MPKTQTASSPPLKEVSRERYRKTTLENGIRIVSETIPHVRSVALGIWLNTGSRDERSATNGVAHFVEHMVFKGTKNYRAAQIARSLESVGGYLNAFTSKEHTCFYARVLDQHLERAVDVLADLVRHPVFDPKEMEKEKQVVLEELKNIEDDPDDSIHDYFDRLIFGDHPLGMPVIGRADTIPSFNRSLLLDHMSRHYLPQGTVVAAAGNVDHETFGGLVRARFRGLEGNHRNGWARRKANPKRLTNTEEYDRPISQAHVVTGRAGYGIRSRQRYPLLVLNTLLGEGMSSRLFQNVRERYGFAYNVYSFANLMSDTGTFGAYIGTNKANIHNSLELIYKEFGKLRARPVSLAELNRTKEQLKGTMMLSLESMSSRMMRLGSGELVLGEYVPLDSILRSIDGVTQDAVMDVASDLLDESTFATVIFKPAESNGKREERESRAADGRARRVARAVNRRGK